MTAGWAGLAENFRVVAFQPGPSLFADRFNQLRGIMHRYLASWPHGACPCAFTIELFASVVWGAG